MGTKAMEKIKKGFGVLAGASLSRESHPHYNPHNPIS